MPETTEPPTIAWIENVDTVPAGPFSGKMVVSMRAIPENRVSEARVAALIGEIGPGCCVLLGVTHADDDTHLQLLVDKVLSLRIAPIMASTVNWNLVRSLLSVASILASTART